METVAPRKILRMNVKNSYKSPITRSSPFGKPCQAYHKKKNRRSGITPAVG